MTQRLQGLELSRRFYHDAVKPILDLFHPGLSYAAALIGPGSEVQGWDDLQSTDHHWGPRLLLFLTETDASITEGLSAHLKEHLPHQFLGHPVSFSPPDEYGVRLPVESESGPVEHMIECTTVASYFNEKLGVTTLEGLTDEQWFSWPSQTLRELSGGEIYHEGNGELATTRRLLAWFPRQVWFELMAREWKGLVEEQPLVGRAGFAGDDRGSRVLAARQVRRLMTLALLMGQQYPPYGKWFGRAFSELPIAETLGPHLDRALVANTWQTRQQGLAGSYQVIAQHHNELKLTQPFSTEIGLFHDRPYLVLKDGRFADALRSASER